MSKDGIFKELEAEKQNVKNQFLRMISELEPQVWQNLPFTEFEHLLAIISEEDKKNVEDFLQLINQLIVKDNVSVEDLISVFPNADEKLLEKNFTNFKRKIINWSETYALRKNWIFESVIPVMEIHLRNDKKNKITVGGLVYLRLAECLPVKVNIKDRWNPRVESFSEYENRVKQTLRGQRKNFTGKIEGYKLKTKPLDLSEKLKWLILWNIEEWTIPDIVINELKIKPGKTVNEIERYEQKSNYVYDEIQKLKSYDLPVRTKLKKK